MAASLTLSTLTSPVETSLSSHGAHAMAAVPVRFRKCRQTVVMITARRNCLSAVSAPLPHTCAAHDCYCRARMLKS
jgi:hypothetical protein